MDFQWVKRTLADKEFREVFELVLFFQLIVYSFFDVVGNLSVPLGIFGTVMLYVVRHKEVLRNRHVKKFFLFLKDRKPDKHMEKYTNALVTTYAVFLMIVLASKRVFLLPEQMLFFGLVGAMYLGKGKRFLRDWIPFVLLILAYEAMRGFADNVGQGVHYTEMIRFDKLFGVVPTICLQEMFYTKGVIGLHDVAATGIYLLHFSAPLILAYVFWCEGRTRLFKHISSTIIITSYAALIIFLLFPAAPPWLAYERGYLPEVHKIIRDVTEVWEIGILWTVYQLMNPNAVAAMPSLHAAYPWIVYMYALRRWGTHLFVLFPIAMALSLVYLGEHYVVDVLAGILLSTIVYFFVESIFRKRQVVAPE
ncbi:MAG: phosphatase PAP2 family protein [Candidatus Micrarchaeota archaeon]